VPTSGPNAKPSFENNFEISNKGILAWQEVQVNLLYLVKTGSDFLARSVVFNARSCKRMRAICMYTSESPISWSGLMYSTEMFSISEFLASSVHTLRKAKGSDELTRAVSEVVQKLKIQTS